MANATKTIQKQQSSSSSWIDEIESRLRDRAGSPPSMDGAPRTGVRQKLETLPVPTPKINRKSDALVESPPEHKVELSPLALTADKIDELIVRFKKT
jgi:hypothetical protein